QRPGRNTTAEDSAAKQSASQKSSPAMLLVDIANRDVIRFANQSTTDRQSKQIRNLVGTSHCDVRAASSHACQFLIFLFLILNLHPRNLSSASTRPEREPSSARSMNESDPRRKLNRCAGPRGFRLAATGLEGSRYPHPGSRAFHGRCEPRTARA